MKSFILITAILELVAGLAMAIIPEYIPDLANADAQSITLARMYGGGALAVGLFSLEVYRNMENAEMIKTWLKTLSTFHIFVAHAAFSGYMHGGFENPAVCILHTIFFLITVYFWFKNK